MLPRLPIAPPYPGPWEKGAAKEPHSEVLRAPRHEGAWNRVLVSMPTLVYPFRADGLTLGYDPGELGCLEYLEVVYCPENPFTDPAQPDGGSNLLRTYPSLGRGACYLWAPGEWWIRCQTGGRIALPAAYGERVPFLFIPAPDAALVEALTFKRASAKPPISETVALTGGAPTPDQILTVQQCLDGLVALEIAFGVSSPAAINQTINFRWRNTTYPPMTLLPGVTRFEGATLPMADAWLQQAGVSFTTACVTRYY